MDEAKARSLCKELLALSSEIKVAVVTAYPRGRVLAVESRIPARGDIPREHFAMLTVLMKGAVEKLEEQYGRCNYILFNFAQGQAILFLTQNSVIVVGTKPQASPAVITMIAGRLEGMQA